MEQNQQPEKTKKSPQRGRGRARIVGPKLKAIAAKIAAGEPILRVAKEEDVERTTIYAHMNGRRGHGELRREIERQTQRLLAVVPDAVDLISETIGAARESKVSSKEEPNNKVRETNVRLRKIAIDAGELVLRTPGIIPNQSQSVHVQNLVVGSNESISPMIAKLLGIKEKDEEIEINPIQDPVFQTADAEFEEVVGETQRGQDHVTR